MGYRGKLTAEEFIDEVNGHNSWQHYPPSKQKVIGWLKQFAEMQEEAINVTHSSLKLEENIRQTIFKLNDKLKKIEDDEDFRLDDIVEWTKQKSFIEGKINALTNL
jgi:hypothetical protein